MRYEDGYYEDYVEADAEIGANSPVSTAYSYEDHSSKPQASTGTYGSDMLLINGQWVPKNSQMGQEHLRSIGLAPSGAPSGGAPVDDGDDFDIDEGGPWSGGADYQRGGASLGGYQQGGTQGVLAELTGSGPVGGNVSAAVFDNSGMVQGLNDMAGVSTHPANDYIRDNDRIVRAVMQRSGDIAYLVDDPSTPQVGDYAGSLRDSTRGGMSVEDQESVRNFAMEHPEQQFEYTDFMRGLETGAGGYQQRFLQYQDQIEEQMQSQQAEQAVTDQMNKLPVPIVQLTYGGSGKTAHMAIVNPWAKQEYDPNRDPWDVPVADWYGAPIPDAWWDPKEKVVEWDLLGYDGQPKNLMDFTRVGFFTENTTGMDIYDMVNKRQIAVDNMDDVYGVSQQDAIKQYFQGSPVTQGFQAVTNSQGSGMGAGALSAASVLPGLQLMDTNKLPGVGGAYGAAGMMAGGSPMVSSMDGIAMASIANYNRNFGRPTMTASTPFGDITAEKFNMGGFEAVDFLHARGLVDIGSSLQNTIQQGADAIAGAVGQIPLLGGPAKFGVGAVGGGLGMMAGGIPTILGVGGLALEGFGERIGAGMQAQHRESGGDLMQTVFGGIGHGVVDYGKDWYNIMAGQSPIVSYGPTSTAYGSPTTNIQNILDGDGTMRTITTVTTPMTSSYTTSTEARPGFLDSLTMLGADYTEKIMADPWYGTGQLAGALAPAVLGGVELSARSGGSAYAFSPRMDATFNKIIGGSRAMLADDTALFHGPKTTYIGPKTMYGEGGSYLQPLADIGARLDKLTGMGRFTANPELVGVSGRTVRQTSAQTTEASMLKAKYPDAADVIDNAMRGILSADAEKIGQMTTPADVTRTGQISAKNAPTVYEALNNIEHLRTYGGIGQKYRLTSDADAMSASLADAKRGADLINKQWPGAAKYNIAERSSSLDVTTLDGVLHFDWHTPTTAEGMGVGEVNLLAPILKERFSVPGKHFGKSKGLGLEDLPRNYQRKLRALVQDKVDPQYSYRTAKEFGDTINLGRLMSEKTGKPLYTDVNLRFLEDYFPVADTKAAFKAGAIKDLADAKGAAAKGYIKTMKGADIFTMIEKEWAATKNYEPSWSQATGKGKGAAGGGASPFASYSSTIVSPTRGASGAAGAIGSVGSLGSVGSFFGTSRRGGSGTGARTRWDGKGDLSDWLHNDLQGLNDPSVGGSRRGGSATDRAMNNVMNNIDSVTGRGRRGYYDPWEDSYYQKGQPFATISRRSGEVDSVVLGRRGASPFSSGGSRSTASAMSRMMASIAGAVGGSTSPGRSSRSGSTSSSTGSLNSYLPSSITSPSTSFKSTSTTFQSTSIPSLTSIISPSVSSRSISSTSSAISEMSRSISRSTSSSSSYGSQSPYYYRRSMFSGGGSTGSGGGQDKPRKRKRGWAVYNKSYDPLSISFGNMMGPLLVGDSRAVRKAATSANLVRMPEAVVATMGSGRARGGSAGGAGFSMDRMMRNVDRAMRGAGQASYTPKSPGRRASKPARARPVRSAPRAADPSRNIDRLMSNVYASVSRATGSGKSGSRKSSRKR